MNNNIIENLEKDFFHDNYSQSRNVIKLRRMQHKKIINSRHLEWTKNSLMVHVNH